MSELQGKAVIVTGASRGIGAATARELAGQGASVVLAARSTDETGEVAEAIRAEGGKAEVIACDVLKYEDVDAAVALCLEAFGRLDGLVSNAGMIEPISRIAESDPKGWAKSAEINYLGVYHGLRAVLPIMERQGAGVVVNVSSGAAYNPLEGWSHYCSAKAGALMLTRAADLECREKGVRVVGLSPGTVATNMQKSIKASGVNPISELEWSDHIPPEWPAKAIAWLLTREGSEEYAGRDLMLREPEVRAKLGLG